MSLHHDHPDLEHSHQPCCGISTNIEDYFLTRRQFLNRVGMGIGALGLATMLDPLSLGAATNDLTASPSNFLPKAPHFPGKAKAVIHIFANGAPSHIDTWDNKPFLTKMHGKTLSDGGVAFGTPFKFQRYGKSGLEVSDVFAKTAQHADDLAVIRSMYTDIPAHEVATVFMNTGSLRLTKPSLGAWTVYGLGTENQNLPGFISLRAGGLPPGGAANYGAAFLPGIYQGSSINTSAYTVQQMIQNIRNGYVSKAEQRRQLDFVHQLNDLHAQNLQRDAALETRLESYEIAFRMQAEATDVFDISKEPADVRAAYGTSEQGKQLLIARRCIERGVRFVQVWHGGWDHHRDLEERITEKTGEIDQPLSALLTDLKQRGLLDSTLVIWGGEFGRKPSRDKNGYDNPGRDHNAKAFSVVMAGGGVKGGYVHGATDDTGAASVKDKVHVHDLHATILHALGFDHTKLTYRFNGRDFRLTDVAGNVVQSPLRLTMSAIIRHLVGASLLATLAQAAAVDEAKKISAADSEFFDTNIRPILEDRCYKCHSHEAKKIKGDLLLDSREALLRGGESGPAVVPGNPDKSVLIQALLYTDPDLQMPPEEHGGKLSDHEIANFVEWVKRGAPDPRKPAVAANGASPYSGGRKDHWSLLPVVKPAVPAVKNTTWSQSPIDNFVLAKLESVGLQPNALADKRTLLRRVTFDLTGLPPSETEIQNFLQDKSPEAFTKVVDRLLASPAYGERWARYWLDLARYSDTKGDAANKRDFRYPDAWTYRDYVINAFNTDKPYNQFIVEQLAADRLVAQQQAEARAKKQPLPDDQRVLAALGFLTLGNEFDGRRDDIIADQIDVTTKAFLGLTVACARCHDHKFDPIPIKDYYSLYGVFANSVEPKSVVSQPTLMRGAVKTPELLDYLAKLAELQKEEADLQHQVQELRKQKDVLPKQRLEARNALQAQQRKISDLQGEHPGAPARANALADVPRPKDYPVLLRGEVGNIGPMVPRRFLEVLTPDPKNRPEWTKGSGRLELANAIADPKNPMTARVLVNRLWQEQFGLGFVPTPDDFGNNAPKPDNAALLDWLASNFVENGWSIKHLLRTIVLSSTYQQSSAPNPKAVAADPDNKLLWRANLRRLDFEEMYDALLAISGTLDRTIGGKSIQPDDEGFGVRRSLYTYVDRRSPPELFIQFDFPSPDVASGRRYDTTVPQQALFLMNSTLVVETARHLTHRPNFVALKTDEERVASLYNAIFQREPTATEVKLGLGYVRANFAGTGLTVPESPGAKANREKLQDFRQTAAKKGYAAKGKKGDLRPIGSTIPNGGPEDTWTKLAHALFQANEAMFIN